MSKIVMERIDITKLYEQVDALEYTFYKQSLNNEELLRSAVVVSGVFTLIGMFIAIYISVMVR